MSCSSSAARCRGQWHSVLAQDSPDLSRPRGECPIEGGAKLVITTSDTHRNREGERQRVLAVSLRDGCHVEWDAPPPCEVARDGPPDDGCIDSAVGDSIDDIPLRSRRGVVA